MFKSHRKLIALGLTAVAAASLAIGTMFTGAVFTDTQQDSSTFTTGTVKLDPTLIAAMDLTTTNMMPGDTTTSSVTVKNIGTAQLRYAVSQTSTNTDSKNLRDVLQITVKTEDTGAGSFANDGNYCDTGNGSVLYATATLGASSNLVGNPAPGAQGGEQTLAANNSQVLCFSVSLPVATDSTYQGATTTTTFSFAAEQTANN